MIGRLIILANVLLGLSLSAALAQTFPGQLPPNTVLGNISGAQAPPAAVSLSNIGVGLTIYGASVTVNSVGAATANSTAIAAALTTINAAGGGTLQLPCGDIYTSQTIDNKYSFIMVQGCGGPQNALHDGGNNITYATRILPTFACAVGTPALYHRTPYISTSSKFSGGGFRWLQVTGSGVAGTGTCGLALEVDTINYGTYIVGITDMVGTQAVYVKAGVSATDIAEAADPQHGTYQLSIRQLDGASAQNSKGLVLDGSSNANTSFNTFDLFIEFCNGAALEAISADNNFISLVGSRGGPCTGRFVLMDGPTASHPVGGSGNIFTRLSGGGPGAVYAQGTSDAGVTAGMNNLIQVIDFGNGTSVPTVGTGSLWTYDDNLNNTSANYAFFPLAAADSMANAKTCRAAITTESMRICNGSANNLALSDTAGANAWGINISGADVRFTQLAGSGFVTTPNLKVGSSILGNSALTGGVLTPAAALNMAYFNSSATPESSHINLFNGGYGFGVRAGTLDIMSAGTVSIYNNGTTTGPLLLTATGGISSPSSLLSSAATAGIGYSTGSGGAITQTASRTTGVTLNTVSGDITLVSAAGLASFQSFTVTNSAVAATDTVHVTQKSGTDLYQIFVTATGAGTFRITYATTGGTTTEQPVFHFNIMKGVNSFILRRDVDPTSNDNAPMFVEKAA